MNYAFSEFDNLYYKEITSLRERHENMENCDCKDRNIKAIHTFAFKRFILSFNDCNMFCFFFFGSLPRFFLHASLRIVLRRSRRQGTQNSLLVFAPKYRTQASDLY